MMEIKEKELAGAPNIKTLWWKEMQGSQREWRGGEIKKVEEGHLKPLL